ncbi:hypothetical protein FA13DRAFT_10714 [Coprinellus micaceus]|uniref:Uncharacterized protein n=1 Tax=Coprinellus micaceus TaxID=71717 RepID=A0A4Y7U000_COPMI|nr:hypothetical protein FA13DRAFT_10714 [Coprinellus micaceus]
MALLQDEILRHSVVELLSLMATNAKARRTMSLEIVSLAFGTSDVSLLGHCELLSQLLSDGRFEHEPTDKVMLFAASAMMTRPDFAPYRFKISTALCCRYGSDTAFQAPETAEGNQDALVEWFTLALFGRHATVREVEKWLERCGAWLDHPSAGEKLSRSVSRSESSTPAPEDD